MANHRSPNWEPEPLRFIGVRYTQQAFAGIDDKADRTGKATERARAWHASLVVTDGR